MATTTTTVSLSTQLLTVAIISLQRQLYHNRGLDLGTGQPPLPQTAYDFVVVGGGTAGSIVAGRLSEDPATSVLLIEAGGPMTVTSDIVPTLYSFNYDWGYRTVPQANAAFGKRNRQVPVVRGRVLGGSHTVNYVGYTRGNARDYDRWASATYGAGPDWAFDALLPYFLRTENNTDPAVVAARPDLHSTRGPLEVSTAPNRQPILSKWVEATEAVGWPKLDFSDARNQSYGSSVLQTTQSATNWTRQTTASAFIEVNIGRPNLYVLLNSQVTRILFDNNSSTPTATGVEYFRASDGTTQRVSANREVILCGGSINSPQLLMLSGIGPRDHLQSVGVTPLLQVSLPVGDRLYEHLSINFDYLATNRSLIPTEGDLANQLTVENLYQFFTRATGQLAGLPFAETYIATGINGERAWPDVNVYVLISQIITANVLDNYDASRREEWRTYLQQFEADPRHFWMPYNLFRPLSHGTVRLASSDPLQAPLIDPAYLSNRQDLAAIVQGISIGMKIAESPYMAPYLRYSALPVPGCAFCADNRPLSRCLSYLACVVQTDTYTTFHPVGGCAMGNDSSQAVVDGRLRVFGTRRLRVIDASVMPVIPNANTNAPTMAIAERGVQLVRDDWRI